LPRDRHRFRQGAIAALELVAEGDRQLARIALRHPSEHAQQPILERGPVGALPGSHHVTDESSYLHICRKYTATCSYCASTWSLAPPHHVSWRRPVRCRRRTPLPRTPTAGPLPPRRDRPPPGAAPPGDRRCLRRPPCEPGCASKPWRRTSPSAPSRAPRR